MPELLTKASVLWVAAFDRTVIWEEEWSTPSASRRGPLLWDLLAPEQTKSMFVQTSMKSRVAPRSRYTLHFDSQADWIAHMIDKSHVNHMCYSKKESSFIWDSEEDWRSLLAVLRSPTMKKTIIIEYHDISHISLCVYAYMYTIL
jgi:hypothetical protein